MRGRMESCQRVPRAHDPEIVFAFAEAELAAILARIVGKGGRHLADLPAGRARLDDLSRKVVPEDGAVWNDKDAKVVEWRSDPQTPQ